MLKLCATKIYLKADNDNYGFQITDLLQLSRKEHECRLQCLKTMQKFGAWKRSQAKKEQSTMPYLKIEGVLLKRQARDAVLFYKLVRKNRVRAFRDYMNSLPSRNGVYGAMQ